MISWLAQREKANEKFKQPTQETQLRKSTSIMKLDLTTQPRANNTLHPLTGSIKAQGYTFTKIAETNGFFIQFSYIASINNRGVVAFQAAALLKGGRDAIFTGDGQAIAKIADTGDLFKGFTSPSVNDAGVVAFVASLKTGGKGIFTGDDRGLTQIANTKDRFCWFSGTPAINNDSKVAFWAALEDGGEGIFTGDGRDLTKIADTEDYFTALASPSINDQGNVAFRAASEQGGYGIFKGNGNRILKIADTSNLFSWFTHPHINNAGSVTFLAYPTQGGYGIFKRNGRKITNIAHTSGCFSQFAAPSLNDAGAIAFRANLNGRDEGIFIATGSTVKKVIAVGDYLCGSKVRSLVLSPGGFNNAGQIAFFARLADGTSGIFRADPVVDATPKRGERQFFGRQSLSCATINLYTVGGQEVHPTRLVGK